MVYAGGSKIFPMVCDIQESGVHSVPLRYTPFPPLSWMSQTMGNFSILPHKQWGIIIFRNKKIVRCVVFFNTTTLVVVLKNTKHLAVLTITEVKIPHERRLSVVFDNENY